MVDKMGDQGLDHFGHIAYVAQQAWIQNATLQNNVLFGGSYDFEKYNKIIRACDLIRDIEMLPAGSDTEIGENGGQKQRVSLARAIYSDASLYLLDDPLSAVDSHVGRHIFENVLGPNGLLKSKTRILVTHNITYLPQVDLIVVLKNNTISEMGSYKELLNKQGAFAEFLIMYFSEAEAEENSEVLQEIKKEVFLNLDSEVRRHLNRAVSQISDLSKKQRQTSISLPTQLSQEEKDGRAFQKLHLVSNTEKLKGKLITTETAESGQVTLRVYMYFFRSVGAWLCLATLVIFALAWSSSVGSNLWLEVWSSDPVPVNGTQDTALRDLRLGVYAGLGFSFAFLILAGTISLVLRCVQASHFLHAQLLNAIIRSPMAYFDTTSVGRIVNRFTEDINKIDVNLPINGRFTINVLMQLVGSLVVITMETPIFLVVLVPIGILYCLIQKIYIKASLQLERLEAITRSPIYNHFSETISGCSTIRAYKKQTEFIEESNRRVDEGISNVYANRVSGRWLKIRLDVLGCAIVLSAVLFAVGNKENMTSSALALSITYALSFTNLLTMCVYTAGDMEKNFVAVERIREYTEITPEASWEVEQNKPPPNWPEQGCIVFNNYKTRYREGLDVVLRGITCTISKEEKVGVVGRTGAGKSSLTLALFRIIEATEGSIMIDGIDISAVGLHDLRSKLTIIPQDPVLFSGTLRHNFDPFNFYTDEKVWTAIKHCHLYDFVSKLPATLHYVVTEGGENLSVGQRQLICLGRALLRKTKVLILDEATAAIDMETDDVLQATIRTEFADCTVITIAHRLNTILDNDRVMVLDGGQIEEFDSPATLLHDTNSLFYSMAKDAGLA